MHLGVAAEKQSQGKERIFKEVETLRAGLISRLNSGSGGISGAQVAVKAFGWAAYLLDLIERQHKSGESLIVNFPYMR